MSLRPRAPAPCAAAACCASSPSFGADRLAAVLAAGMRLGPTPPAPTGVVFTMEPDLKTCPICTEPMSGAVSKNNPFIVLECQHAFHVDCISKWTVETEDEQPTCPVCRVAITQKDVYDIRENALKHKTVRRTLIDGGGENWTAFYRKGRLTRQEREGGSMIEYYDGEKGRERLVRLELSYGAKQFYEGEQKDERLVRRELPDGRKEFYEGEQDDERLVRIEFPDGEKWFYEGEEDAERLVRVEFPDGKKWFYEGEKGAERRVRVEFKNGDKEFYEGEARHERLVRREFPDGEKQFYEGEKGAERLVRDEFPPGVTYFIEGEKGAERTVRIELPDGEKWFYEGEKGAERRVRVEPASRLDDARAKRPRTRALVGRREPAL